MNDHESILAQVKIRTSLKYFSCVILFCQWRCISENNLTIKCQIYLRTDFSSLLCNVSHMNTGNLCMIQLFWLSDLDFVGWIPWILWRHKLLVIMWLDIVPKYLTTYSYATRNRSLSIRLLSFSIHWNYRLKEHAFRCALSLKKLKSVKGIYVKVSGSSALFSLA